MRPNDVIRRFGLAVLVLTPVLAFIGSDSVQFFFPAACQGHNHPYHGTQVNNQVPPA